MSRGRSVFVCLLTILAVLACWEPESLAQTEAKTHRVEKGQTLGAIARRYQVSVDALCKANRIRRTDRIRPGQQLVIPSDKQEPATAPAKTDGTARKETDWQQGLQRLEVPGAPPAFFYEPMGAGRTGLRPVFMVLHGRGGSASAFCARWAPVVRPMGWLVCPSAPHAYANGQSWENDWVTGRRVVQASHEALRAKYGRRVQLVGNTLVGFSEGAFVAMNVGVREPRTFNRWLILAADDSYWGAQAPQLLGRARGNLRRVYLITGKQDEVFDGTLRTQALLRQARVPVHISDPSDMGHEVALEGKRSMYQAALTWLQR
jgi:predicted esterase